MTSNQTHFSLITKNISNEINVSRSIKILKKLHEFELSRKSRYQIISFRICIQRKQRNYQLIFKASINRDVVYLRDWIHKTNVNRKRDYLITKSDDSVDVWRRIFSDDNNIRRQSRRHCFERIFNFTHEQSTSIFKLTLSKKKWSKISST